MNPFETIPVPKIRRNGFPLSHERKFSMEMGKLVPILCQAVVPGDTFKVSTEAMIRFAPMIAPIMHRVDVYVHYFFVPNRLVWSNFRKFITGGEDGEETPAIPQLDNINWSQMMTGLEDRNTSQYFGTSSLWDYLGLATGEDLPFNNSEVIAKPLHVLPFRAYQLIYNEYYRDQNLTDPVPIYEAIDGRHSNQELQHLLKLRNRAWKKDYFTGALPFPQRGEDVMLPLHGDAPLSGTAKPFSTDGTVLGSFGDNQFPQAIQWMGNSLNNGQMANQAINISSTTIEDGEAVSSIAFDGPTPPAKSAINPNWRYVIEGNSYADLSQVTAATVNELRRAIALQTFLERSARGGNRYIEYLLAHFGVKSSDARLQRPEYLGGGVMPLVVSEVLQNAATTEASPQGNMSGHGIAVGKSHKFKAYFEEHGYVMGIMSVIPRATYQQGIPRDFMKLDRFDWYIPAFAHLGEQEIYNAELYAKSDDPDGVFGYVPRYSEYKFIPSSVHGDFRTNMNFWHLGRIFANTPTLSEEFMTVDEDKDGLTRIFAAEFDPTTGEEKVYQHLWVYVYNNVNAIRPMPIFGVPKI